MADDNNFRSAMENALFRNEQERQKTDKLLNKEDTIRIKNILMQPMLSAKDVNEIQAIITANEARLGKFEGLERYLHFKVLIQIQRFASRYVKAIMVDEAYKEELNKNPNAINQDTIEIRLSILKDYAMTYKEVVNSFLFGTRSSLGEQAFMIEEMNKEKKDVHYSGNISSIPQSNEVK